MTEMWEAGMGAFLPCQGQRGSDKCLRTQRAFHMSPEKKTGNIL